MGQTLSPRAATAASQSARCWSPVTCQRRRRWQPGRPRGRPTSLLPLCPSALETWVLGSSPRRELVAKCGPPARCRLLLPPASTLPSRGPSRASPTLRPALHSVHSRSISPALAACTWSRPATPHLYVDENILNTPAIAVSSPACAARRVTPPGHHFAITTHAASAAVNAGYLAHLRARRSTAIHYTSEFDR
jgi:hypothetical protein